MTISAGTCRFSYRMARIQQFLNWADGSLVNEIEQFSGIYSNTQHERTGTQTVEPGPPEKSSRMINISNKASSITMASSPRPK
ncbi:MAG: hypothetical protein P0107_06975 [Nitrosomonas sp.]|nr:hypothetical protein [Nitrosomonas sp.]